MESNSINKPITKGTSAANSFRTFILTLSVSLIVFSLIYYFMSSSGNNTDIFESSEVSSKTSMIDRKEESVENTLDKEGESVFGKIASSDPDVQAKYVLAGTDEAEETTQSTSEVPETGIFSITTGLLSAFVLFILALIVISSNPRRLALDTFEKTITKK